MTTDQERWREVAREVENALYNKGFQERINLIAIALAAAHREGMDAEREAIAKCHDMERKYLEQSAAKAAFENDLTKANHLNRRANEHIKSAAAIRARAAMTSAQQDGDATKKPGD